MNARYSPLVHVLNGEPRPFEVSALLERAAKPPEGLRIALHPWASHPPPVNHTEWWYGSIFDPYSTLVRWKLEAVGRNERECESQIRIRLELAVDAPLPPYCAILPPSFRN